MPKLYSGPNRDFYRVWERNDGSLLIEVLHENTTWRDRLLSINPRVGELPHDALTSKKNNIRAAVFLFEVIQDYPDAFRQERVEFTAKLPQPPNLASASESRQEVHAVQLVATQSQHRPSGQVVRSSSADIVDPLAGREFFYRQIYRLRPALAQELSLNHGLYAVLEQGEMIGQSIDGLPPGTLRCLKVGMSDASFRVRIQKQYFGTKQRAAVPRRHVGDALIGRAMIERREFAGFDLDSLISVLALWNAGTSPSEAIARQNSIARRFNLATPRDLTHFESPVEREVTAYMEHFRFIEIPAYPEDVLIIEDRANSLLRDAAETDPSSTNWLGRYSSRDAIRNYGLWAVVGVTKKYRPYATHTWNLKGRDDQSRPIADWLLRLRNLIEAQLVAGL